LLTLHVLLTSRLQYIQLAGYVTMTLLRHHNWPFSLPVAFYWWSYT